MEMGGPLEEGRPTSPAYMVRTNERPISNKRQKVPDDRHLGSSFDLYAHTMHAWVCVRAHTLTHIYK